jgi:hypothetical protein
VIYIAYLDDILIYSSNELEYKVYVKQVVEQLQAARL